MLRLEGGRESTLMCIGGAKLTISPTKRVETPRLLGKCCLDAAQVGNTLLLDCVDIVYSPANQADMLLHVYSQNVLYLQNLLLTT
jgi:hypothetical protein